MKTWKIIFYISTLILSFGMLWGGYLDATQNEMAVAGITFLGYPSYFATIIGVAKILGVIGIWQGKIIFLRNWAYAGFVFDTLGAIASTLAIDAPFVMILPALLAFVLVIASFISARKLGRV